MRSTLLIKFTKKIRSVFRDVVLIILYGRGWERLLLILQYITLPFLRVMKSIPGLKGKNKITYYYWFLKTGISRSPGFILDNFNKTLRVCLTYRCNASCEFCYVRGLLEEFPKDMDLNDFRHLAAWAKRQGWENILFLGGEPTVHPQFERILDICYNERMSVYLSTNGLINGRLIEKFKTSSIRHIAFSYPQDKTTQLNKKQFLDNLEYLSREKNFIILSGVLDGQNEQWKEIIETAARFRLAIRWSLLLPGYARARCNNIILGDLNSIGSQLFEVIKTCFQKKIICYVYRPVPACIFTPGQWDKIRRFGKYTVYTRCPLGFEKKYYAGVTVNPDLSTYACISFFIKGPSIISFKDRSSLNKYYEKVIKDIMSSPPRGDCNSCSPYKNFLSTIGIIKDRLVKDRLDDRHICQGGCYNFR